MKKEQVIVGMSGGVDSSVAAYLLLKQGYEVIGITMQVWQDEETEEYQNDGGCCGLTAVDDARRVAEKLEIPYYVLNFKDVFKTKVIDYFIEEYQKGRTPNPCIACNHHIKWEHLLKRSKALGADYIATGHYARIIRLDNGRFTLKKSISDKDQTYALYNLTQYQLKHTLMPVGNYSKEQIRQIAKEIGLTTADKPDSQEICFIPDNNYAKFIEKQAKRKSTPGNFVDTKGNILGKHKGIDHYTIGQRKGLEISLGKRIYVKTIDLIRNEVILVDDDELYENTLIATDLNFMKFQKLDKKIQATAKIRYSHQPAQCTIQMINDSHLECKFDKPQRAITPGQAIVFYDDDLLIGGGTIKKT